MPESVDYLVVSPRVLSVYDLPVYVPELDPEFAASQRIEEIDRQRYGLSFQMLGVLAVGTYTAVKESFASAEIDLTHPRLGSRENIISNVLLVGAMATWAITASIVMDRHRKRKTLKDERKQLQDQLN